MRLVTFNDSFFMAAMFLLSGLFVWPSLQRKGVSDFLRGRWLRLGLPYAVGAVILMPIAYYAVELRNSGPGTGFARLLVENGDGRPLGERPDLVPGRAARFDMLRGTSIASRPARSKPLDACRRRSCEHPAYAFWMFLAASVVAYVPLDLYFGIAGGSRSGRLRSRPIEFFSTCFTFFVGAGIGAVKGDRSLLSDQMANWRGDGRHGFWPRS